MKRAAIGLVALVALLGAGALGYGLAQFGGDGGGDESTATSMTATEAESIAFVDGREVRIYDTWQEAGYALTCDATERADDVLPNRPEGEATPQTVNGPGWLVVCSMRHRNGADYPQWRTVFVTAAGEIRQLQP